MEQNMGRELMNVTRMNRSAKIKYVVQGPRAQVNPNERQIHCTTVRSKRRTCRKYSHACNALKRRTFDGY